MPGVLIDVGQGNGRIRPYVTVISAALPLTTVQVPLETSLPLNSATMGFALAEALCRHVNGARRPALVATPASMCSS
jgi:hypothetical protein